MYEKIKGLHDKRKLLERIEKKLAKLQTDNVADVVRDYRNSPKGIPIVIRGYNGAKIADLRRVYTEQAETLIEDITTAENLILAIPDERERLVLQMRYIDNMKIGEIALELEVSDRTIQSIISKYKQ